MDLAHIKELASRRGWTLTHPLERAGARVWRTRICLRGDTDFSLTAHFDRWAERVDIIFGMDAHRALVARAEGFPEAHWKPLERKEKYETLTEQKRRRYQRNEKQRIVREREYLNLELNHERVGFG